MRHEKLYIAGGGSCLAPRMPTCEAVDRGLCSAEEAAKTGIVSVAVAGPIDAAPPEMAARAGLLALRRAEVGDIGLVLHANVTYQGQKLWAPASYVQRRVLGSSCPAMEVRQASNGGMAAMELAAAHLRAYPEARAALLTAADHWPLPWIDRWRSDPGTVYADGAAAVVLSAERGFARVLSLATVSDPSLEGMHRTGAMSAATSMCYREPVDLGAAKNEFTEEAGISFSVARVNAGQDAAMKTALADAEVSLPEIDWFVLPHFGRRRLHTIYARKLGIDLDRSTGEWGRTIGHLGAGDQFAGLTHLAETGALRAGQRCMLAGVGSGFTWSYAVLEILETPHWADHPASNAIPAHFEGGPPT